MKRKLSTPVAVSTPDFVVPRVSVRHGGYVVPRYRARPHGMERKLLGMASVSELRVVPPPQDDDEEVECLLSDSSCDTCESSSPAVLVYASKSTVRPRKRVTFAESESVSPSARDSMSPRRGPAPRRSYMRSGGVKGKVSPEKKNSNSDHVWYSSRLAHRLFSVFFVSTSPHCRLC